MNIHSKENKIRDIEQLLDVLITNDKREIINRFSPNRSFIILFFLQTKKALGL